MNRCLGRDRFVPAFLQPHLPCIMRTNLLVIGASARWFAESAARVGWQVAALDLFADQDLEEACSQVIRLSPAEYPAAIPARAAQLPPGPVVYGGGIENHPQVLARLAADRPLVGNRPVTLRKIRQPAGLAALAAAAGWHFPETHTDSAGLPTDSTFLQKPRAGAGGHGIVRWTAGRQPAPAACWQRLVAGVPLSVSLLLGTERPRLLGLCRQFVGRPWCHAAPFGFGGGVELLLPGPAEPLRQSLERLLEQLAGQTRLAGLVGVDFILPRSRPGKSPQPTLIEINPRPTATMELIERRTGTSLAASQLAAFGWSSPEPPPSPTANQSFWAKAILCGRAAVTVTAELDQQLCLLVEPTRAAAEADVPLLADRPVVGSQIDGGRPILTIFAAAATPAAAVHRLRRRIRLLSRLLDADEPRAARNQPASRRGSAGASAAARNCIR